VHIGSKHGGRPPGYKARGTAFGYGTGGVVIDRIELASTSILPSTEHPARTTTVAIVATAQARRACSQSASTPAIRQLEPCRGPGMGGSR
jgi:hypothetical protein